MVIGLNKFSSCDGCVKSIEVLMDFDFAGLCGIEQSDFIHKK